MANPTSRERLRISFESPDELRTEFEKNIVNGGIFVPSEMPFSIRDGVTVEIALGFADTAGASLSLHGEVVHCVPEELASSGAVPGVAVQFDATVDMLRESFASLIGEKAVTEPTDDDDAGARRRKAKRRAVRVPVRVMPESSAPFEATSRDLSATGILLSLGESVLSLNEIVRVCLWHPDGEQSVEVDGQVVREVANKNGRIAAVAVAFERSQAADSRVREVIDALGQAGHRSRLGGIRGSIEDLGLATLLQMFGSSAPMGTWVCDRDGEQGWVAFAEGALLRAEVGSLRGHDALVKMLDWPTGRFEFQATTDQTLIDEAERRPLEGAILQAVCAIDEREASGDSGGRSGSSSSGNEDWAEQTFVMPANLDAAVTFDLAPETIFDVDLAVEASTRSLLGKVGEAVLDLTKAGLPIGQLLKTIPEDPQVVYSALQELIESGLLRPR